MTKVERPRKESSLARKLVLIVASITLLLLALTFWMVERGTHASIEAEFVRSFDQHAAILELSLERELREVQLALDGIMLSDGLAENVVAARQAQAEAALRQLRMLDRGNLLDFLFISRVEEPVWARAELSRHDAFNVHQTLSGMPPYSRHDWQSVQLEQEAERPQHLLFSTRQFLEPETGRVVASLIAAIRLNDNTLLLNRMRQRSGLSALGLTDSRHLLAVNGVSAQYVNILNDLVGSRETFKWSAQWRIAARPVLLEGQPLGLQWQMLLPESNEAGGILIRSMSILSMMVLFAMLLIYIALRQQVVGPLRVLAHDVRWMVQKRARQLSIPAGHRHDEIGSLVYSFNELVSEISASEIRYRQLLDDANVISWEMDSDWNFTFISSHAERLLGYRIATCYSPGFWLAHIHPEDRALCSQTLKDAVENGLDVEFEYRMIGASGQAVWVREITNLDLHLDRPYVLRGVMVDITGRKQAELALRKQLRFEELVAEMAQQFSASRLGGLDATLNRALQRVGEFFEVDRTYLFLFSDDGQSMSNTHEWCADGIGTHLDEMQAMPRDLLPWWNHQISNNLFVHIPDTSQLPDSARYERDIFTTQHIQSLLAVPLLEGSRPIGFFGFDSVNRQRNWSDEEVGLMQVIGASIVAALSRAKMERDLRQETTLLGSLLDSIPDLVFFKDVNGVYLGCNHEFCRFVGRAREEITGLCDQDLFDAETAEQFRLHDQQTMQQRQPRHNEEWISYADGTRRLLDTLKAPLRDAQGEVLGLLGVSRDITERKEAEDQIHQLAFFDPLTQLPNRRLLLDRLALGLAASARSGEYGALLFIDLDNFKTLNDTLGHDVGDMLLVEVARRLLATTREADTVARLGGDEFVVMLEDLGSDRQQIAAEVERVAEKLLDAINHGYVLNHQHYHTTPSIGVTLFQGSEVGIDELLKHADMAMYRAKAAGRNTIRFFEPAMQAHLEHRAAMEADLRHALSEYQFVLHYQPQFDSERRVVGAEALVRWHHPVRGHISPVEFIPLAEETGLILPLGHWILERACQQLYRWQSRGWRLDMAVNISARQFRHPDFVDIVHSVLDLSGIDPGGLKLEITESMMLDEVDDTIEKMTELKRLGVSFSIDDFGTGYSSLSYLKRLPLDQLKIDQSFVRDVVADSNDAVIVRAIIAMADSLGFDTIAEGVETEEQHAFLLAQGCRYFQGYLFSVPLCADDIDSLIDGMAEQGVLVGQENAE